MKIEEFLLKHDWVPIHTKDRWISGKLLLREVDNYIQIVSLNNYDDVLFKGIIETEEEFISITKILKKGTNI